MKVNTDKTAVLCVSDALAYQAETYLCDRDGVRLDGGDGMKVLGFRFGRRPTMDAQVEGFEKSVRQRLWVLRHLRRVGFTQDDLKQIYVLMIRPVFDYCAVVYHSMLLDEHDERLKRLQARALQCIYGTGSSARKMRDLADISTLRARREDLCDKFVRKCLGNPRYKGWFPLRGGRVGRNSELYLEQKARCDRLANSPIFYFRRRLNGKVGKKYGKRNAMYRE